MRSVIVYTTTAIPQATQKPTPNQSPVIKSSPQIVQKSSSTTQVASDGNLQSTASKNSQAMVNTAGSRHTAAAEHMAQSPTAPSPLNTASPSLNRTVSVPNAILPQPTTTPPIHAQRSISMTMGKYNHGEESPVMNETLSVIDEHITDLNTPRSSLAAAEQRIYNDSGSEYSSHLDHRLSYINGHETDEEEQEAHTENEIIRWTPAQVAEYLQEMGVERRHCEVFREQEISGEVLLGMDQASIFIPEFDLGLVGRRLRTWHKIKALQEEVKASKRLINKGGSLFGGGDVSSDEYERSTSRASTNRSMLPRTLSLADRSGSKLTPSQAQHGSPRLSSQVQPQSQLQVPGQDSTVSPAVSPALSSGTFKGSESPRRPSAATVREFNHTRRHSSADFTTAAANAASPPLDKGASPSPNMSPLLTITTHKKQPSFDRNWTMSSVPSSRTSRPTTAIGVNTRSLSTDRNTFDPNSSSFNETPPTDFERGYLSGGDFESKKSRNVLRKRDVVSASHSRQHSYNNEHKRKSSVGSKRHSRFGSADSIRDTLASVVTSPTSKMGIGSSLRGRFRSGSKDSPPTTNSSSKEVLSPTVTKLDYTDSPQSTTSSKHEAESPVSISRTNSDLQSQTSPKHRSGIRTMSGLSDSTVVSERTLVTSPSSIPSPIKESPTLSPSRTGSTTTSGASKSFELESTDASSKGTNGAPTIGVTPPTKAARRKPKKETSAYTRGLEKKTPQEQMIDCDYSGWMKKKSPSLMTTWKPRLFVLRGRRLSYYYTENDTEEKGLIDISSHRVLPADNEHLANIHATLTGAKSTPTSPQGATTPTINSTEAAALASPSNAAASGTSQDSIFIFKLVPPRTGLSRAVNFTKPTVHYFAVDNIKQGRLWMAALMKATIDRDENSLVTSTYQQKTISLAKAKAMRHRPPNLMGLDEMVEGKKVELARKEAKQAQTPAQAKAEKGVQVGNEDEGEEEEEEEEEDSGESGGGVSGGGGGLQIQGLGIGVEEKEEEGNVNEDTNGKDEKAAAKNGAWEEATPIAPPRPDKSKEENDGLGAKALEAGMGSETPSAPLTA